MEVHPQRKAPGSPGLYPWPSANVQCANLLEVTVLEARRVIVMKGSNDVMSAEGLYEEKVMERR